MNDIKNPNIYYPADIDHLTGLFKDVFQDRYEKTVLVGCIYGLKSSIQYDKAILGMIKKLIQKASSFNFVLLHDDNDIVDSQEQCDFSHILETIGRLRFPLDRLVENKGDVFSSSQIQKAYSLASFSDREYEDVNSSQDPIQVDKTLGLQNFLMYLSKEYDNIIVLNSNYLLIEIYDSIKCFMSSCDKDIMRLGTISIACNIQDNVIQREMPDYWQVSLWSTTDMPSWEPYDNIKHFMCYGWGDFSLYQSMAAKKIAGILKDEDCELSELHDVGCGNGEFLKYLQTEFQNQDFAMPDKIFAYDPSSWQSKTACKTLGINTQMVGLKDVNCWSRQKSMVMMLGNTLAHVGAKDFRNWLTSSEKTNPEYLLFDFAVNWRELLNQAEPEIVCGSVNRANKSVGSVLSHMTTAGGPGWVKRGIVVEFPPSIKDEVVFKNENTIDVYKHSLFTRQYADSPQTYLNILKSYGYVPVIRPEEYTSGWGEHVLYLLKYNGPSGEIEWPSPSEEDQYYFNEPWYDLLLKCWRELAEPCFSDDKRVELFPIAILPFAAKNVYARYIPRTELDDSSEWKSIYDAIMWVVDPRDKSLRHAGAVKTEDILPYAPSIYRSLLSSVPTGVVEHLDITSAEFRIDINSYDLELADLERKWMRKDIASGSNDIYFSLPIYILGMPCYLVVIRVQDIPTEGEPGEFWTYLHWKRDKLRDNLKKKIKKELIDELVLKWTNITNHEFSFLETILDRVRNHPWTSWIDTLPGNLLVNSNDQNQLGNFEVLYHRSLNEVRGELEGIASSNHFVPQTSSKKKGMQIMYEESIDIGIVIALKEEFRVLHSRIEADVKTWKGPITNEVFYLFEIVDNEGTPYRCAAVFAGEKGNLESALITDHLKLYFDPKTVVNIGIAASVDDDLSLADVIVADQINLYMYSTAANASETGDGFEFQLGQRVFQISDIHRQMINNFEFTHKDSFIKWGEECNNDLLSSVPKDLTDKLRKEGLIKDRFFSDVAHLSTGPIVGKSEAFSKWLKGRQDRETKMLDMESGGVALSVYKGLDPNQAIVIKGISDFGDERKKELEATSKGAFRQLAMNNALRFLWMLVKSGVLPRKDDVDGSSKPVQ